MRLPHEATIEVLKKYNRFQAKTLIEIEKYLGKYELNSDFQIEIVREGEKMFALTSNQGRWKIIPISKTTFEVYDIGGRFVFEFDDKQNIQALTIVQNGEHRAKKIE